MIRSKSDFGVRSGRISPILLAACAAGALGCGGSTQASTPAPSPSAAPSPTAAPAPTKSPKSAQGPAKASPKAPASASLQEKPAPEKAAPPKAPLITLRELADRRDLWPAKVRLTKKVGFSPTEVFQPGTEMDLVEIAGNDLHLDRGNEIIEVPSTSTDILERASALMASLTPEQLAVTSKILPQRPELWPVEVQITKSLGFSNGTKVPVGRTVQLRAFQGDQVNVYDREFKNYYTAAINETDVVARARERVKLPEKDREPFFLRSVAAAFEPASGSDNAGALSKADYVIVYQARLGCGRCAQFLPELEKFYERVKPAHPEFEAVFVSADFTADDMKKLEAREKLPGAGGRLRQAPRGRGARHADAKRRAPAARLPLRQERQAGHSQRRQRRQAVGGRRARGAREEARGEEVTVVGAFALVVVGVLNAQDATGPKVEEQVVGPAKQGNFYSVSPRGAHLATVTQKGSRFVVVIDGVEGPKFDDVVTLDGSVKVAFSPDGTRTAYLGRSGDEFVLVVDGKELMRPGRAADSYGTAPISQLGFTSNSKHVWFLQQVHKSNEPGDVYTCVVFDGVAEIPGGATPVFSLDGEHHAYVAVNPRDTKQQSVILDGKPAGYSGTDPKFTGDGQHLLVQTLVPLGPGRGNATQVLLDGKPWLKAEYAVLYPASVGDLVAAAVTRTTTSAPWRLSFLVIGGKKIDASEAVNVSKVTFSPDGKRYAAECDTAANSRFVVVDGKKGQEYQSIVNLAFSPDSSRCAYQGVLNGKFFVVVDGEESDGYTGVQEFAFGGGKRIGYIAHSDYTKRTIVVDGVAKEWATPGISGIVFSADGSHYAHRSSSGNTDHLVVDGVENANFRAMPLRSTLETLPLYFVFSPDGRHIACFGAPEGSTDYTANGLVLDGKRIQAGQSFLNPTFSPDSRHLFWMTPDAQQRRYTILVDGQRAAEIDASGLLLSAARTWEMGDDGVLAVLAQDGEKLKRLRITPSAGTSVDTLIANAASVATGKPAK